MSTLLQPAHSATQADPTNPFLSFQGVSKVYPTATGPYCVLNAIDLDIHQGEFLCVIGHSGCGKSTLLNMVSGLSLIHI